jgi:hypothetical protein
MLELGFFQRNHVKGPKVASFSFLLSLAMGVAAPAQVQVRPTQGDIVVLALDTSGAGSAAESFVGTDRGIHDVLASFGEFQVVSMPYRLHSGDVAGFVRRCVTSQTDPPTKPSPFTQADRR